MCYIDGQNNKYSVLNISNMRAVCPQGNQCLYRYNWGYEFSGSGIYRPISIHALPIKQMAAGGFGMTKMHSSLYWCIQR
jgi:hypothetical protein